ncbi:uncharacterized protein LOC113274571 isoform X1 [Papaver somniferum]|uniref:uncharacterized protein LOC113274571 isoform X1 n=1 Tax=Papaver somniferum TaxID=3469 RepID=UPI000E6F6890|nr:uncharacterized protein LOC113274571 isoform X1 [Papaver somniferum]XP_026379738.1 uncharacterized protein LOC113274571 isoform X1 [Papaver somniferum]XP_026379739.1 uncharacterized protein LOC113274571 isoform X1 [Papaver somniferum]
MEIESVIEFLSQVPLLQRLPTSSLHKIAQLIQFKHYNSGEYVAREGEIKYGIYFIWHGEVEVRGVSVNLESEDHSEIQLKIHDYFGHGAVSSFHEADVIALTKLTCLMLPSEYSTLLQPNSIWSAQETHDERLSMVERVLQLEPIDVNIFRGFTLPEAPTFAQVFGGQLIAQSLAAATKTVDCGKLVHSLHSYFLLVGNLDMPVIYEVHRLRDGNSFATRRVDAIQNGNVIFTLLASFQKDENGFEHQEVIMPSVLSPETLLTMEELRERRLSRPPFPRDHRENLDTYVPWPVDIKFCEEADCSQTKTPPRMRYWFKAKGRLSDDLALHRCVVAYTSDLIFSAISLNPHYERGVKTLALSLDHSMWFHRPFRADDWILYVIESPCAASGRGYASAHMFNQKGELIISLVQEALTRKIRASRPIAHSNL